MKFLIAVGSKEYSGPTLDVGMRVAKAFNAKATIIYVGEKISAFSTAEVLMAQENLQNWQLDRQGVDVLAWAFNFLGENEYISSETKAEGFNINQLLQTDDDRCAILLEGIKTQEVGLILRNGGIIQQLREEVKRGQFDITIIGGSQKRRMSHDLIQFIDSSIFVVNQIDSPSNYRILLAVNDSPRSRTAVKFGVRVAQAFDIGIDIITIRKRDHFSLNHRRAAKWAGKFMHRFGISFRNIYKVGDPVEIIKAEAGNDHIIIMGDSTKSPFAKYFKGSVPLKVLEDCKCPVLIVK